MNMQPTAIGLGSNAVAEQTMGGNFLFSRDTLEDDGKSFGALAQELGVNALRYPGGAITEFMFDINEPDKTIGYDKLGFEKQLVPLTEFMGYAEDSDSSVTIVLPTRTLLSENHDANGDRYALLNEEDLDKFVSDVIGGVYGDVRIDGFEIGNEYWGSGEMTAVEYGRISSEMAAVIDKALNAYNGPNAWVEDTDIIVQAGTNYGYSSMNDRYRDLDNEADVLAQFEADYGIALSPKHVTSDGNVNWTAANNVLLLNEFDAEAEHAAVDAVAHHLYTRDLGPAEGEEFHLRTITQQWEPEFDGLKTYITEWNQKGTTDAFDEEDYGLHNAHELLNIMEDMTAHGVDTAHVWPLSQLTDNALSRGFDFESLKPGGEMFKMMNAELPGLRPIHFESALGSETEASTPGNTLNVHAFADEDRLVLYLASNSQDPTSFDIDTLNLITGSDDIDVTLLGVQEGQDPGSIHAQATVETLDPQDVMKDGIIEADLMPFEIMQVVIDNPKWTPEMRQALSDVPLEDEVIIDEIEQPTPDELFPTVPVEDSPAEPDEEEDEAEMDVFEGLEFLLIFLPLLGLAGAF